MEILKGRTLLKKYTITEHLAELKTRLTKTFCSFIVIILISFQFSWKLFDILSQPLVNILKDGEKLYFIYTKLTECFATELKIALVLALLCTTPIFFFQLYQFIKPGLYESEKKIILQCMFISPLLFLTGIVLVYFIIIPITWKFFISFNNIQLQNSIPVALEAKVSEYIDLVIELCIGFGLAFQLPIVLLILVKFNILHHYQLKRCRRYAIVLIFIIAAILTPPDVVSQLILAIPLIVLYEIFLLLCKKIK